MSSEVGVPSFPFVRVDDGGGEVIVVPDPEGAYPLGAGWARMLCDRGTGIGGDGIVRVVPISRDDSVPPGFQDAVGRYVEYWTADGVQGEVCARIQDLVLWYLAEYHDVRPVTTAVYTQTRHAPGAPRGRARGRKPR